MDITEVRIKLMESEHEDRLLGFCSITFDFSFVVRDLKIIRGTKGPFVAMPSRKLMDRCHRCGSKNQLRAAFCNNCGCELHDNRSHKLSDGKAKLYADIAHPINSECRDLIQCKVLEAYENEIVLAQRPDYVCRYEDFGEYDFQTIDVGDDIDACHSDRGSTRLRVDEPQSDNRPHDVRESNVSQRSNQDDDFGRGVF